MQQQYISIIEKSGKRMLNIINDIVSISKIESGQMDVSMEETNINHQIEFIYSLFRAESERKGLQLLVKNMLPFKECLIKTDREKLYAILTNLVGNALKFTRTGSIEFGVEKKGDFLEFFVKDTGIGIAEHQKEIIFERFRQVSEAHNRVYEGAGLGLTITKAYVKILGGATTEQEQQLGQYGHDLGMAFQIVDDVLDLTASESVLGKPVASDLREGKVTMAVIHALERCTPLERKQIETILRDRAFNGVAHADILAILNRYGSLEYASKEATGYAESACKAICTFPDSEIKRALLWAPEFVVAREK